MMIIFVAGDQMLVLNPLQKERKFNRDYCLEQVLPSLSRQRRLKHQKKAALDFVVDKDNSMCHNARKIAQELVRNKIQRAPYPPYSPDLSPCGF
jgi:transposase